MSAPERSDAELREQSVHLLWEFRQLMQLATHLYDFREQGVIELVDPLDAAALEAFCLHARALVEFLWRDRAHHPRVHRNDAVAGDWFAGGAWEFEPALPPELTEVPRRTGFGVAHICYNRIDPAEAWGWDHVGIAHRIAYRFACFVQDVPDERVHPRFKTEATDENLALRRHMAEREAGLVPTPVQPIGTPAHPSLWIINDLRPEPGG